MTPVTAGMIAGNVCLMPPKGHNWTRDETLQAFDLYCRLPFGQLHQQNPDVRRLAETLGRTPGAVAMKACNFASLDSTHQSRGVLGLGNRAALVEQIWDEFQRDSTAVADEIETLNRSAMAQPEQGELQLPAGPTETWALARTRRVQTFFRKTVLTSYGNRCSLTELSELSMLNASHIMPWSVSETERANPANGVCLNALHDRAFDRGLMTFDTDLRVVLSPRIRDFLTLGTLDNAFRTIEGNRMNLPSRFLPDQRFLGYHRELVFIAA